MSQSPTYTGNTLWQIFDTNVSKKRNLTLVQDCWTEDPLQFRVESNQDVALPYTNWTCFDGTNWIELFFHSSVSSSDARVFEESIYWNITRCTLNNNCSSGGYCSLNQFCLPDVSHASNCSITFVQNVTEFNGSCVEGECWNKSNNFICNRKPNATASPNSISDFTCKNWTLVNWTESDGDDPDGDSLYFNVKIGDTNGTTEWGTGTTNGSAFNDRVNATNLITIADYYWVLQTCDNHSYCVPYNNSDFDVFNRTNCAPESPTNLVPLNASSSQSPVVFTWTTGTDTEDNEDTGYDAKTDHYCVGENESDPCTNANFTDTKSIADNNLISLNTSFLAEKSTYYWALRTDDGFLNSSWIIYKVTVNVTDITVSLSTGVTEILFKPNLSTSQQVEPECQNSTFGCITVTNKRGYTINISVSTNTTYPVNYREGDSSWNFNHNSTQGNHSLWGCVGCTLTDSNRSANNWALNITY